MPVRFVLIAAAALTSTNAFAADAPKAPVQAAAQPQSAPAKVVLASADDVRGPSAEPQATAPKRPHVGRVTTCRCGGQVPAEDADSQPEQ